MGRIKIRSLQQPPQKQSFLLTPSLRTADVFPVVGGRGDDRKYVCSSQAIQRQAPRPVADARHVTTKIEAQERVGTKNLI